MHRVNLNIHSSDRNAGIGQDKKPTVENGARESARGSSRRGGVDRSKTVFTRRGRGINKRSTRSQVSGPVLDRDLWGFRNEGPKRSMGCKTTHKRASLDDCCLGLRWGSRWHNKMHFFHPSVILFCISSLVEIHENYLYEF